MAQRSYYRNSAGVAVEIAGRIRALTLDATVNAEEGSSGTWQVQVDDPTASFSIGGHRIFYIVEDSAPVDDQIVAIGYTQNQRYGRGDLIEGIGTGGRVITVDIADLNTILGRRVFTATDTGANRPAETDVQRFTWATRTVEASLIDDARYVDTSNPVNMDAVDYRGQFLMDVIEGCAEASGKNYGLTWFQTGPNPHAQTVFSIFYLPARSTTWASTARLTNVAADVDDVTTFVVASAELLRSPARVRSGILLPYDGGQVYDQNLATAVAFARIDMVTPAVNIKSAAKAQAEVTRMLGNLAREEMRLEITFNMRPADVNRIKAGMRVQVRLSHVAPEIGADYVWARMLDRKLVQSQDETGFAFYQISGTFSVEVTCSISAFDIITDTYSLTATDTASGFYPPLYANGLSGNDYAIGGVDGLVFYTGSGGGGARARPVPNPLLVYDGGTWGGWSFRNYGAAKSGMPTGFADGGASITNPKLQIMAVGPGLMTLWATSVATASWELWSVDTAAPLGTGATMINSGAVSFPSTAITVPSGGSCFHYVLVNDLTGDGGSLFYGGFDWLAT